MQEVSCRQLLIRFNRRLIGSRAKFQTFQGLLLIFIQNSNTSRVF